MKRILDHDPVTGVTEIFHDTEDGFQIETIQDVAPILDLNKSQVMDGTHKSKDDAGEWWHVARIPMVVQLEWLTKYGVDVHNKDHTEGVKRLLNSNEYAYLKRAPITV